MSTRTTKKPKHEKSKPFEERFFRLTDTLDGAKIDGFVDPDAAALIRSAFDAIDRPDPTQRAREATVAAGSGTPTRSSTSPENHWRARSVEDGSSPNIDAVLDVNRVAGHEPVDIFGDRGAPGYADAIGRRPVSPETIERLLCDCNLGRVLMRGESEVLDVGRRIPPRHPRANGAR